MRHACVINHMQGTTGGVVRGARGLPGPETVARMRWRTSPCSSRDITFCTYALGCTLSPSNVQQTINCRKRQAGGAVVGGQGAGSTAAFAASAWRCGAGCSTARTAPRRALCVACAAASPIAPPAAASPALQAISEGLFQRSHAVGKETPVQCNRQWHGTTATGHWRSRRTEPCAVASQPPAPEPARVVLARSRHAAPCRPLVPPRRHAAHTPVRCPFGHVQEPRIRMARAPAPTGAAAGVVRAGFCAQLHACTMAGARPAVGLAARGVVGGRAMPGWQG